MVLLRCSKCGSDAGFLIETADRKTLEVKAKLPMERILKTVLVTCTYCNNRWDHVPISLKGPEDEFAPRPERKIVH